jgi:GTP-binding protein HflX
MLVAGKAVTVMVKTEIHDHSNYLIRMEILNELLEALGYNVAYRMIQTRSKPAVDYLLGRGKLEELKDKVKAIDPDIIVFYNTLTSKQKWNLEKALRAEVLDRYDVVLRIFNETSRDILSKLQIQLAELRKSFPYIKLQAAMKFKKTRAGFKGGGEYAYHKQINAVQKRIKILKNKIEKIKEARMLEIEKRKSRGDKIAVLVGHYNAGKTTLFNKLTGLNRPVGPLPFTTLSSKYAKVGDNLLIVDTIGFVVDQDPRLISSFEINILDILNSDIVVLVIDSSDKWAKFQLKLKEVLRILDSIGVAREKIIPVLNKSDLMSPEELEWRSIELKKAGFDRIVAISAEKEMGIDLLVDEIRKALRKEQIELAKI